MDRVARSPFRRVYGLARRPRASGSHSLPLELTAAGFAAAVRGACRALRGIESRSVELEAPLDAIVVPVPRTTPSLPRQPEPAARRVPRPRPRPAALARPLPDRRRRHRDPAPPLPSPLQAPHAAAVPGVLRRRPGCAGPRGAGAGRASGRRRRARSTPTGQGGPATAPAVRRLGRVYTGDRAARRGPRWPAAATRKRPATSASSRHGLGAALEMVRGRTGEHASNRLPLAPPYFPLDAASPGQSSPR